MGGPLAGRIWERSSSKSMSRTDPVQAVFDAPVAADDGRELGGSCLSDGRRGHGIAGLGGPLLLPARLPPAHDLDGLGVREDQASIDGDGPDGAFLGPTVAPDGLGVAGRDLAPHRRYRSSSTPAGTSAAHPAIVVNDPYPATTTPAASASTAPTAPSRRPRCRP